MAMQIDPDESVSLGAGIGEEGIGLPVDRVDGRWRLVWQRFRTKRLAMLGFVVIVLLYLLAFVGPHITKWGYTQQDFEALLVSPNSSHWFGTNEAGYDTFAQTVHGLQKSLIIGILVALLSTGIAAIVGSIAGYFGKWTDSAMMWIVNLFMVIPAFLIIAIMSPWYKGKTWLILVLLLAAFGWMITSRIVRGMTVSLKEREYVLAARYMGLPARKIIFSHILPNIASLLIVDITINVNAAVLAETTLSYLGFGIQPPDTSIGTLLQFGTQSATTQPWLFWFPAVLLVIFTLAVSLVGDGLRDAFDPTSGMTR